jgi:hypothetical protein
MTRHTCSKHDWLGDLPCPSCSGLQPGQVWRKPVQAPISIQDVLDVNAGGIFIETVDHELALAEVHCAGGSYTLRVWRRVNEPGPKIQIIPIAIPRIMGDPN